VIAEGTPDGLKAELVTMGDEVDGGRPSLDDVYLHHTRRSVIADESARTGSIR
jgi:hypothetical protein